GGAQRAVPPLLHLRQQRVGTALRADRLERAGGRNVYARDGNRLDLERHVDDYLARAAEHDAQVDALIAGMTDDEPVLGGRQVAEGVRAGVIGEHLELPAMAVHAHTRVRDALARLDVEDAPAKLCTRRSGGRKQVQNG